jgi:ketosteroid isomerase-like protein
VVQVSSTGAREELTAWFDSYLDALNAHDIPGVLEFMRDDVVYTDMAVGERMEGRVATG